MVLAVHVHYFREPVPKEATPTNSDTERSPTPTKPSRQTRGRKSKMTPINKPPSEASESDDDDAEEVASSLANQRLTPDAIPPVPSSDDFGGYSDDG